MDYIFLFGGLISLVTSLVLLAKFFRNYGEENLRKVINLSALLFFIHLALAIFSFIWFFGYFTYDYRDFSYIYSFFIVAQTFVLFGVFYFLFANRRLFYWLLFYLVGFISIYVSLDYIPFVFSIISFLLTLFLFLNLYSSSFIFKNVSYVGIFYSALSVLFQFLIFFNFGDLYVFSLISSVVFLLFIFLFLREVKKYPVRSQKSLALEKESGAILFMKYFIFMIVLINLVLVATVSLHEFSHVAVSRYFGCESRTIAYEEGGYPYSEIVCSNLSNKLPIALAGPLGPVAAALILLFIGGRYMRPIAFLSIGFNLLAGYKDFLEIGLSMNLILGISLVSVVLLFFGVVYLARARMEDYREFGLKD